MGNRAVITTKGAKIGIYLQWNGGRDSVNGFVRWAELAKLPVLDKDGRGFAQFLTVLTNFFGNNGLNVHLMMFDSSNPAKFLDTDNGVYVLDGWNIVERHNEPEFEQRSHDLEGMLKSIDESQPEASRLGEYLNGFDVPYDLVEVGDRVAVVNSRAKGSRTSVYTVLGFCADVVENVPGVQQCPYVDMFEGQDNSKNPNARLRTQSVRVLLREPAMSE